MTHEEKRAWIMLVVTVSAYTGYVITVLGRANRRPLLGVSYAPTLLWSVGAAIVASVVAELAVAIANPKASREKDVRDRAIGRLGEYTGHSLVIIGAVAAMVMAMAGWDRFWIANVIYLCFALSAVLGSITKIVAYRGTFPPW